jgi:WD repeat-containing protein 19
LDRIQDNDIYVDYARAQEEQGKFSEAASAYEKAKSFDNAIRLYLQKLNRMNEATELARKTRSKASALMLCEFFRNKGEFNTALEFMLIAGLLEDSFQFAMVSYTWLPFLTCR